MTADEIIENGLHLAHFNPNHDPSTGRFTGSKAIAAARDKTKIIAASTLAIGGATVAAIMAGPIGLASLTSFIGSNLTRIGLSATGSIVGSLAREPISNYIQSMRDLKNKSKK